MIIFISLHSALLTVRKYWDLTAAITGRRRKTLPSHTRHVNKLLRPRLAFQRPLGCTNYILINSNCCPTIGVHTVP
jgi:hypothetical protein